MRRIHFLVLVALALPVWTGACTGQPAAPPAEETGVVTEVRPLEEQPAGPTEPEAPSIVPSEARYAATHVLIAWQGAVGAAPTVTRSKEEALALANAVLERAQQGEDLAALARELSDDTTAPRGGTLGVYATGTMVPDFEKAVASVAVGELGPLVRTPFGYHVVRRDPVTEAHFRHILIAFQGGWRSAATRSEDEARTRAQEVHAKLEAGEPFDALAREYSDDPSVSVNGGDLGLVAPGQLVPAFEDAAFALKPGALSDIVQTPYGLHVIQRVP